MKNTINRIVTLFYQIDKTYIQLALMLFGLVELALGKPEDFGGIGG